MKSDIPKKLSDIEIFNQLGHEQAKIQVTWDKVEPLLRHAQGTHSTYTSHGPDHSLMLLKIIDCALSPLDITLTEQELYILIVATLLHDIGMVGKAAPDASHSQTIRDAHHLRTRKYIQNNYQELGIDKTYKTVIAEVASAHRKLNIDKHIQERAIGISGSSKARTKLCAALLRLADECHITEDRIPEDYKTLELPEENIQHFLLHFNVRGLRFDKDNANIEFSIEINDEEFDKFAIQAKQKIQSELDGLQNIFQMYRIPYRNIIFQENRESLICNKIVRMILENGKSTKEDIANELIQKGENKENVFRILEIYRHDELFEYDNSGKVETCNLVPSFENLCNLADTCLKDTKSSLAYVFTNSEFTKKVLNDAFLTDFLAKSLSLIDPREVIFRVLRLSPSALKYAVTNKDVQRQL